MTTLKFSCLKSTLMENWCVDATKEDGSLRRLINDDNISPNAKMKYLTMQQKPHLCLFATLFAIIKEGEEITYNYGDSDWPWRLKELEKEMSQSPDCTHSTSTTDNTEQIRAENDQDQMTTSVPNETDPVLDSLPINSEWEQCHRQQRKLSLLLKFFPFRDLLWCTQKTT